MTSGKGMNPLKVVVGALAIGLEVQNVFYPRLSPVTPQEWGMYVLTALGVGLALELIVLIFAALVLDMSLPGSPAVRRDADLL